MDLSSTSGLATYASNTASTQLSTEVGIATLKKALDTQAEMATQMIQGIQDPRAGLPDHVGQSINVTA